jgi:hypothetical protein
MQTTRRAALVGAGAFAGSVVNLVAISTTRPAPIDPIFAAIERVRQLDAAWSAVNSDEDQGAFDAASGAAWEALRDLVRMTPTTIPGCVAMMRYINNIGMGLEGTGRPFRDTSLENATDDLLDRLADSIEAVQS